MHPQDDRCHLINQEIFAIASQMANDGQCSVMHSETIQDGELWEVVGFTQFIKKERE